MTKTLISFAICLLLAIPAMADTFTNGDFETGNANGWTIGGGFRGSGILNNVLLPADFLPGGAHYSASIANSHSSIVTPGADPRTGNLLNRVYSGKYSWRVEDTTYGGYASVISQTVINYTAPDIFFAWAAVLEGAHGTNDAATVKIALTDVTQGDTLITREYNAASTGGGVDARFTYNPSTGFFWTPWQIEQLTLPAGRLGDTFALTVLASDCEPTGHAGYLYLDGFGSVAPPPQGDVPEPGSIFLFSTVIAGIGFKMLRKHPVVR